jgi:hypothetical protein
MEKYDIENKTSHQEVSDDMKQINRNGLTPEDAEFLASFPVDRKKALIRKIDWRLVPMLLFLYLITYIDKVNIGNAKIEGLLPSLGMSGDQCKAFL